MLQLVSNERVGQLAPGMAEHVEVEACSDDAAYHYDNITIRAEVSGASSTCSTAALQDCSEVQAALQQDQPKPHVHELPAWHKVV